MAAKPTKLGRKGDPRMHKAVAARLANPNLSLLEALRAGGFGFPCEEEGGYDATLTDEDGVTLGQRKNQLSRRLRLARQNMEGRAAAANKNRRAALIPKLPDQTEIQRVLNQQTSIHNNNINNNQTQPRKTTVVKRSASVLSVSGDEEEDQQKQKQSQTEDDMDIQEDMPNMDHRMAKYHPQFHPVFPTLRPTPVSEATASPPSSFAAALAAQNSRQSLNPSGVAVASLDIHGQFGGYDAGTTIHVIGVDTNALACAREQPRQQDQNATGTQPLQDGQPGTPAKVHAFGRIRRIQSGGRKGAPRIWMMWL